MYIPDPPYCPPLRQEPWYKQIYRREIARKVCTVPNGIEPEPELQILLGYPQISEFKCINQYHEGYPESDRYVCAKWEVHTAKFCGRRVHNLLESWVE